MTVFGTLVGAVGAGCSNWLRGTRTESSEATGADAVPVDALVVGGGVQGLAILNRLKQEGYSAVLVTNSPLGAGQTLHSHGSLNSGYAHPRSDLRSSLKRDWLPFAERSGLQLYGEDQFYILTPPGPFEKLRGGWEALGYDYEAVSRDRLPSGIQEGDQFRENARTQVVKINEYTFPKRQLIRLLAQGVKDQIIHGDIKRFRCASARADDRSRGIGNSLAVESVEIEARGSGKTVALKPNVIITATGTGTRRFIGSLVDGADPAAFAATSDDVGTWREGVLSEVEEVKCRSVHMLCIRAPGDVLPAVNLLVLEHRLMIITASVDGSHDHRSEDPGTPITWYVTPLDPDAEPARTVPDTAQGVVEERAVVDGFHKLLKVFPSLKTRAEASDSRIEFAVYAGYKQDIGEERNRPVCKQLDGLRNVIVALPSLVPGAFVNASWVMEFVQRAAKPTVHQPELAGATGRIEIGQVTENTREVEWANWHRLLEEYPQIAL
ncbi:MAG: FAD-dependent oxidoreductase [Planctomycetota bacterium]